MNTWVDWEEWQAGLRGWGIRGALVAFPSWLWALADDYRHPLEILAMISGVVCYVLLFATGCSLKVAMATEQRRRALDALRWTAWLKLSWILFGILVTWVASGLRVQQGWILVPLLGGVYADLGTGLAITQGMEQFGRWSGLATTASANSFIWTFVTTLLQGAAVTLGLFILALGVLAWSWLKRRFLIFRHLRWVSE
jgi:hypothetical protein